MPKTIYLLISVVVLLSCGPSKKLKKQSTYMDAVYTEIKKDIPEAQITLVHDSLKVLFPDNLLFDFDSDIIKPESSQIVQRLAAILVKYKKTGVLINGYTDNRGTTEYNKTLSQKRAKAAESILLKNNVIQSRLYAWGHGMANPIGDNATEEGRIKNRRVEFIILYDYKPQFNNENIEINKY